MASDKPSLDALRIDRSEEEESGGRGRLWIILLGVVLVAAAAGWWFTRPRPAQVKAVAAEARSGGPAAAGAVLNASGYVTARRQATVSSKITGKVVDVLVEEGMEVREGQVLARLDDSTARKQLALAEARLGSQRRALTETEVRLREAKLNQQRMRRLLEQGVTTQAQLDTADAGADSLAARLDLGRQEVAVAEREIALRRQDLDDLVIRAPFSGIAVSKDAQPGEMISPVSAGGGFTRTGICTLVDMKSLEVEVDVNESYIHKVRPGQKALATLDAYPDWQIPARVIMPVPTADRQKATVRVRLSFDQLDPRILPDMGVKVAFLGDEEPGSANGGNRGGRPVVVIPRAAVRKDGDKDVVYVVQGDHVERRAVGLAAGTGDEAVVTSGLAAGERVVTEGPDDLKDGARVSVQP
ncbi:MAG TPA: efflux RND transporter periplasmic adaptor subunit [Thermoanaerobaculia bacterium]|jgi:RND family efflux transporter MFP subunit|nr:efflux RND transporter periplasmic adaptor subunit [Thermoanaerobaculia bacterium]